MLTRSEKLQTDPAAKLLGTSAAAWYGPRTVTGKQTPELHLVVACADRKRSSAGTPARLGDVDARSAADRCAAWWRLLSGTPARTPARDLYVGDHWSIAKRLPDAARRSGYQPHLWVASAGYGLVPDAALLAPYSATFSVDSPDSIATAGQDPRSASQHWWEQLSRRRVGRDDHPRSLTELAERAGSGAIVMVVASPAYVGALEKDLEGVLRSRKRVRLMLLTSSPGPEADALRPFWIPTTAPLRMALGGALTSLHARVARRLLEKIAPADLDAETARQHVSRLASRAPELPTIQRSRSDDDEVRKFIRQALRSSDSNSHTRLLREYRASGRACEQTRFRELFLAERGGR